MIIGLSITTLLLVIVWLVSKVWFLEKDLEDMSECFENYKKNVIGHHKSGLYFTVRGIEYVISNEKTLIKYVEDMNDYYKERIKKLEEYLGIKRLQKEEKVDKYVKIKK